LNLFFVVATNKTSDSIYCAGRGGIFKFLNKSLHESLLLHPVTILTIYLYFKNVCTMWRVP